MLRNPVPLVLWLLLLLIPASVRGADEPAPPAAAWIPQEALVVVEIPRPRELLDRLFEPPLSVAIASHPEFQRRRNEPGFQEFMNLVQYFERRYDTGLHDLLGKLSGGGVTLAAGPRDGVLLIVEAEDPQLLDEVHEFFLLIARGEADKAGHPERVASAEYRGITGWTFAPNEAHAIVGNRLLVANKPELLKAAIDRIAEPGQANLAALPQYQEARAALPAAPLATVFTRVDVLKQLPQLQQALDQQTNPLATLLFAPLVQAWEQSTWLMAATHTDGAVVSLTIAADGRSADPADPAGFARSAGPGGGALPNASVPRQLAGLSFYRDLHRFYAAKDRLFPERTSGLIFFENMMGIFFTGRDFAEEVLAETTPEVRVVVARQEYTPEVGTPHLQLPAVALVFRMRNPETFSRVVEEAWQKAVGLINFTRGQQAEPGLIIDRPSHGGVKFTVAAFEPEPRDDAEAAVDVRFNFQPALAMPGEYLILSSTEALARDLIDALQQESASGAAPLAGTHSLVELHGVQAAGLLRANRETLIRQNMLEKGHSREQAEGEIDLLLAIVGAVENLRIAAGDKASDQLTLELKLDLQP